MHRAVSIFISGLESKLCLCRRCLVGQHSLLTDGWCPASPAQMSGPRSAMTPMDTHWVYTVQFHFRRAQDNPSSIERISPRPAMVGYAQGSTTTTRSE